MCECQQWQKGPIRWLAPQVGAGADAIRNRLTQVIGIEHPILLTPMDLVSGGRLAAAVTHSGGLDLLGGGYGDGAWIERDGPAIGLDPSQPCRPTLRSQDHRHSVVKPANNRIGVGRDDGERAGHGAI